MNWIAGLLTVLIVGLVLLGALALTASLSGWSSLGKRFASSQPVDGARFRFRAIRMGRGWAQAYYQNRLSLTIAKDGLGLRIFPELRSICPSLFIPWSQVESMSEDRVFWSRQYELTICNHWSRIVLFGKPGRAAADAYQIATGRSVL